MRFRHYAAAIAATLLIAAAAAATSGASDAGVAASSHPLLSALHALDLSPEQRGQVRKILFAQRGELRAAREAAHASLVNFVALDPQAADYNARIAALADGAANGVSQKLQRASALQTQIYAVLNPLQKSKLVAMAQGFDPAQLRKRGDGSRRQRLAEALSLSEQQRSQVRAILARYGEQTAPARQATQARVVRFLQLDPAAPGYAEGLQALTAEFSNSARQRVQTMAALQTELYAVLSAEQRSKLVELAQKGPAQTAGAELFADGLLPG